MPEVKTHIFMQIPYSGLTLSQPAFILETSLSTDRIKTDPIGCYCPDTG
jgi:hypothetical protein